MKLIITLGNPGEKYQYTRHNMGFLVGEKFAKEFNFYFKHENKFKAEIAKTNINGEQVIFCRPQTFMNLSGEAVRP